MRYIRPFYRESIFFFKKVHQFDVNRKLFLCTKNCPIKLCARVVCTQCSMYTVHSDSFFEKEEMKIFVFYIKFSENFWLNSI